MPSRTDVLSSNLDELQQDLTDLWRTLTRDPAKEKRKERAWTILAGASTAIGAIVARRVAAKLWGILTGETAPIVKQPPAQAKGGPSARATDSQPQSDAEAERTPTAAGA